MTLSQGQVLQNRYRIDKPLGRGAGGAVYSAWDSSLNIPVAVKAQFFASEQAARLFVQQARALGNLRHPGLPHVIDYFSLPSVGQCLVTEFIDGSSLQDLLAQAGPLPEDRLLAWMERVWDALAYLHGQQPPVVHRDIKPDNIRVGSQGRVALVDYGIELPTDLDMEATWVSGESSVAGEDRAFSGADALSVVKRGSPYAAPEFFIGAPSVSSDIYSCGATLYCLLTGRPPVDAPRRQMGQALPRPRQLNPEISASTDTAILRALEMEPARRFASVVELRSALAQPRQGTQWVGHTPEYPAPAAHSGGTPPTVVMPSAAPIFTPRPLEELPGEVQVFPIPDRKASSRTGLFQKRGLAALLAVVFGLLCLGAGLAGGAGVYWFVLNPAATTTATLPGLTAGGTPTPGTTSATAGAATTPVQTVSSSRTPFPTNTFSPSATFSPRPSDTASPTVPGSSPTAAANATWQPCAGIYPSRLHPGDTAYVSYNPPTPNRVRRQPNATSEIVGFIQPGEKVDIVSGPVCSNQWIWWEVRSQSSGLSGWTAEGDQNDYWLVPLD